MTNVLVTAAGIGQRFVDVGVFVPKPIIRVGSVPIVKLTTDSLPFINDLGPDQLAFAVLQEHIEKWSIDTQLTSIYNDSTIIPFDKLTRGNLETASHAVSSMTERGLWNPMDPIFILDSDNKYDGSHVEAFVREKERESTDFASICYFEPLDEKTHWCFAQMRHDLVWNLLEKDIHSLRLGAKPMMGTFYFSTAQLFLDAAEDVLFSGHETAGEFYMSQAIQRLIDKDVNVYGCEVTDVVPLGTPEDVNRFEHRRTHEPA